MIDLETIFHTFPVADRLTVLRSLGETVLLTKDDADAAAAADLMTRLGYPGSAESSILARRSIVSRRAA